MNFSYKFKKMETIPLLKCSKRKEIGMLRNI